MSVTKHETYFLKSWTPYRWFLATHGRTAHGKTTYDLWSSLSRSNLVGREIKSKHINRKNIMLVLTTHNLMRACPHAQWCFVTRRILKCCHLVQGLHFFSVLLLLFRYYNWVLFQVGIKAIFCKEIKYWQHYFPELSTKCICRAILLSLKSILRCF